MNRLVLMERITKETFLHIGIVKGRFPMRFFVVLSSKPNERKPVWMGVVCWLAQIPLLMGIILGGLGTAAAFADGYLKMTVVYVVITVASTWLYNKLDGLFQKRPSWDKEDYVPTEEEWEEWHNWVHCEEEYEAWELD